MRYILRFKLICDKKDRFLLNVTVADNNLHKNNNIKASAKRLVDRIRNADGGKTSHKQVS